jgi:hypothetical protein
MSDSDPKVGRNKKSDKAKKNRELTGGLSSRHVRIVEARSVATTAAVVSPKDKKKK